MTERKKTCWLLAGFLCLALWPTASAQETRWETLMADAVKAYQQADYAKAEKLLLAALKEAEKSGEQVLRLAVSLLALGRVYHAQGNYAEAEPLHQRALAIREKALGPEHADVAQSPNNLALLYKTQGKYAEAEPLYQRARAIWEKALGPEHPHVATALEDYADLLRKMDRDAEAEKLEARAQAIRAKHTQENPPN
jgi:tetratricopeptide (TPR) repeat protein